MHRSAALVVVLLLILPDAPSLSTEVLYRTFSTGALTVHYRVVLPVPFDAGRPYPTVLAFPGGAQDPDAVDRMIDHFFRDQAEKRGYIVVAPVAPNGKLFFEDGDRIFPAFLKQLLTEYHVRDQKFHAAGVSNGGISAFHVAALYPEYFLSITAFPGYLPEDTPAQRNAIAALCIHMFVGELDPLGWQPLMQSQAREFAAAGIAAQFSIEPGQPHQLATLQGANASRLFDLFQQAQHGCPVSAARGEPH